MTDKIQSARVRRKRTQKFNTLLDHAMQIIIEKGFANLTMRMLASSLDMTPGALYRYFPSKGHIIGALGNRTLVLYSNVIHAGVEKIQTEFQNQKPHIQSLIALGVVSKEYFDLSLQSYENHRILNIIMVNETRYMTNPPDYTAFMQGAVKLLQFTATQYDRAMRAGAIEEGDAFLNALSLLGHLQGCLQLVKFGEEMPDLIDPKQIHKHSLLTHLKGLGAKKEDVQTAISLLYRGDS
ncbi:MAG: helix-turn-helix domain-containing protein [Myxococcota bacterium]|nr:helix-turn-helix domain-containing protein [Myxococcota bacterium]